MRVKICGIKSLEDAMLAIQYGADAIGLLVGQTHNSEDFITIEEAKKIVSNIPPFIATVLVTHMEDELAVIKMIQKIGVNTVQLHSSIKVSAIEKIKRECPYIKIIKLVHIIDDTSVQEAKYLEPFVDAILLDTINLDTNQVGGTGKTHDWTLDQKIVSKLHIPVIIAGGLTVANVKNAIEKIQPFGVDVNSGVKNELGYKDSEKLKNFIRYAKQETIQSKENPDCSTKMIDN